MRRIIAMLIGLILCFSAGAYASAQETESAEISDAIAFVRNIGIVSSDWLPSSIVTRGEFAELLLRVCDQKEYLKSASVRFEDIDSLPQEQRSAIETACALGYMNGFSESVFGPEKEVTIEQAAKTFMRIAGYDGVVEYSGGSMSDYVAQASREGMLKGLNKSVKESCTVEDLARMIYASLNMQVLTIKQVKDTSSVIARENNFLTRVMHLYRINGYLTDNGSTSLSGKSRLANDQLMINGEVIRFTEATRYVQSYIGRNVRSYVRVDEDTSEYEMVYARPRYNDDATSFTMENFIQYNKGVFIYEDEKGNVKEISTAAVPYIIYNGEAVSELKEEYLDYEFGNITILDYNNIRGSIIIIEGYYSAYVSDVDYGKELVYLSRKNAYVPSGKYVIDEKAYDTVNVFAADGKPLLFKNITPYSLIDICQSENSIKIVVPDDSYQTAMKISGLNDDSWVVADGTEYKISKKYKTSTNALIPKAGDLCNFFVNSFGYIAWVDENEKGTDDSIGYLTDVELTKSIAGNLSVRLMTAEGQILTLNTADKLRIRSADGTVKSYDGADAYGLLQSVSGLVQYEINGDNKISFIGIPLETGAQQTPSALKTIYDKDSGELTYAYNIFGSKVVVNNSTRIFVVNEAASTVEDRYTLGSFEDLELKQYVISAYTFEQNSPYARYLVVYADFSSSIIIHDCFVVTDVRNAIDENGEELQKLEGYITYAATGNTGIKAETLYGDNELLSAVVDCTRSGSSYAVKAGDILKYNVKNGKLTRAELLYRSDMENVIDPRGRRGGLAGSIGYWDAARGSVTNPFVYNSTVSPLEFNKGSHRYILGSVLHVDDQGNITYTTQDLTCETYNPSDARYITECVPKSNNFVTINHLKDERYEVKDGGFNDIRSYNDCGSDCSRILVKYYYGNQTNMFIIN